MIEIGLIPAAGQGVRAYPATTWMPKVCLQIAGGSLISRNVAILRESLGIREIVVIVGYLADQVRAEIGDGSALGVHVTYVTCDDPSVGLARGMLTAERYLDRPFVTLLGDELYLDSNHAELEEPQGEWLAVCGVMSTDDSRSVQKNYAVRVEYGLIRSLEEKPQEVGGALLGCGTYLFKPELFEWIRSTPVNQRTLKVELTDAIAQAVNGGKQVYPFYLRGHYINVNSVEDYNYANYLARSLAFPSYKVSVVIPAYNEEDSIGSVVADFAGRVDEVLVVDNCSRDRTAEIARSKGARVESVPLRGYGDAIKWGLDYAVGDIFIVVEADHSFRANDLGKMLEYLKDADMVIGTRTTRQMIEQGSNMGGLLRWGNVAVGKLVELLWWSQEPRFTDVGCTYRGIWRDAWRKIRDRLHGVGPEFSPEMMIEILRARKRVIEIPVSYHPRAGGESKHSQGFFKVARTALRMLRTIIAKRLGRA
ncbi:MAG: glycosyltransferase [Planctomycetota bacterium]